MGDGCWRMGDGCWDTTDLSCGETRGALWQHKMSVAARVARNKGGGLGPPPFVVPLCLATTEVLPCRNRHLVLPQRTSRLPTREIGRVPASITHPPASITHPPASISIHQHASCIKHHEAYIFGWGYRPRGANSSKSRFESRFESRAKNMSKSHQQIQPLVLG